MLKFIGDFEVVFIYDWGHTSQSFGLIEHYGNFFEPGLEDEYDDWHFRGLLLEDSRYLLRLMRYYGLEPILP